MNEKQIVFYNSNSIKEIISDGKSNLIMVLHKNECFIYVRTSKNTIVLEQKYYSTTEEITSAAMEDTNLFLGFESGSIVWLDFNNTRPAEFLLHHTGGVVDLRVFKNILYSSSLDGSIYQFDLRKKRVEKIYLDILETTGNPSKLNISLCEKYLMSMHTNNILHVFFTNADTSKENNIIKPDYKLKLKYLFSGNSATKSFFYGQFIVLYCASTILIISPNFKKTNDFILVNRIEIEFDIFDIMYFNGYCKGFDNFLVQCENKVFLIDFYTSVIHKTVHFDQEVKCLFENHNQYFVQLLNGCCKLISF
ncbi:hypothetical protein CDIK_1637 [Cucumispora dikerogammari]|nr:hypothetical protein CDIK_1637 [Cucumispora dikerogammari]